TPVRDFRARYHDCAAQSQRNDIVQECHHLWAFDPRLGRRIRRATGTRARASWMRRGSRRNPASDSYSRGCLRRTEPAPAGADGGSIMTNPMQGLGAIFYKEVRHMRRDPMAILFALVMPVLQMIILGAAIDTNIRQVRTAVYDASGSAMMTEVSGSSTSRAF